MTATYEETPDRFLVGTLTCDRCGATYRDGQAERVGSSIRMRAGAIGWGIFRPHAYRADDRCPDCGTRA